MTIIPLIINLIIFGFFLTYFFRLKLFLEERLWIGFLIGVVILGYYQLFLRSIIKSDFLNIISFLIIVDLIIIYTFIKEKSLLIKQDFLNFQTRVKQKSWFTFFVALAIFVFIFTFLASQLLIRKNGSLLVQPGHAYSDISLHLGIISSFAFGDNFPPQSPILAGTPISYPFLFDFITAIFINSSSLAIEETVAVTGILITTVVILSLAYFGLTLTKNKLAAVLFLIIFVFSGGFGFLIFIQELFVSSNPFDFVANLQKDYTALKDIGYQWINVVISMFLPQRGFLLGLSVGLLILRIFWQLTKEFNKRSLFLGVLLFSFLPIIHAHTMIALTPFLIWLTIKFILKNPHKIKFVILIGSLGVIIAFILSKVFLGQAENPLEHIKYQLGWMAHGEDLLIFYLKNFGLSLILLPIFIIVGLMQKLKIAYFAIIGSIWFILPSLFIFQPWDFDNSKLFIYWYLSGSLLIAHYISKFLISRNTLLLSFGLLSIFLLTFSATLDIYRLLSSSGARYEVYSPPAIKMSEFVKSNTSKDAVFLAVDKFDNPAVVLAGRKTVVGYHGWLWTYGLNYYQREADVRLMLAGEADLNMFKKYNISHAIFFKDPTEYNINKEFFRKNFQLIYNLDGYEVFKM